MKNPKYILITGASSGLGAELAKQYADSGVKLFLSGRNDDKLEAVAEICRASGANVSVEICDVKNSLEISKWINSIEEHAQIDLVIANAGISAGTGGDGESFDQVKNIFDTNIYGVINTISPVIEHMKKRRSGQVAIISSLAGYRGLPSSPAYSASKAAVKIYGEALRGDLAKHGVEVSVVTPGYIRTPMTEVNDFYMPFLLDVDKAVDKIIRKLKQNKSRIAFPLPLYFVVWLMSALPTCITDPIFARLPSKPNDKQQQSK